MKNENGRVQSTLVSQINLKFFTSCLSNSSGILIIAVTAFNLLEIECSYGT